MSNTIPEILYNGPRTARLTVVLAHGAGAPMDSPFMAAFARGLATQGYRIARFEFPYMVQRRLTGVKKPPDRQATLLDTWRQVIASLSPARLVIGGKSLGGRMATLIAAEAGGELAGLVCLGYPFHPPGKPERLRTEHLADLSLPSLIVQGERDPFGNRSDVAGYRLSPTIRFHWAPDGDHSLKPRKASGRTEAQNWQEAIDAIDGFLAAR